ncbi:AMP-binding protein, partial [uncultured Nitratireductor sp.]|uniref:AMP-binding protein n=1 Tax=uncultured Nitratireductor sp. TaxID=520953 RepID=UPI00345A707B
MASRYHEVYRNWQRDPDRFWAEAAAEIDWFSPWEKIFDADAGVYGRWFPGATCNTCFNAVDRHVEGGREDQPALVYDSPISGRKKSFTYGELKDEVSALAAVLKDFGVGKGDRVVIYMPMVPEAVFAMLACARIGAVHSVVFGGFSPDALAGRIADCESNIVITADEGVRGGRKVPLKANVDKAAANAQVTTLEHVLVVRNTGADIDWTDGRDAWLHDRESDADRPCEEMNAEDPLFILYTSGSTGKPKGVLHTTGGYLVYAALTHEAVFDYHPGDIYWCTADVGWVTGHTYIVYGPLANGATTLMFEGVPNYPDSSRFWQV